MIPDEELHEERAFLDRTDFAKPRAVATTDTNKPPCLPATPPSAEPAEETSGGERRTAAGAVSCCRHMASAVRQGMGMVVPCRVYRDRTHQAVPNLRPTALPFWFCPWCSTKLDAGGPGPAGSHAPSQAGSTPAPATRSTP